jgi:hypothetical protein
MERVAGRAEIRSSDEGGTEVGLFIARRPPPEDSSS